LYVVGGSIEDGVEVRRLNVDSGKDWEAGGVLKMSEQRSNRPAVSLTVNKWF
jgi:hypothetical protein